MRCYRSQVTALLLLPRSSLSLRVRSFRAYGSLKPSIEYTQSDTSFLPSVHVKAPPSIHRIWQDEVKGADKTEERPSLFCSDELTITKPPLVVEGGVDRYSSEAVELSENEAECREAVRVIYSDADIMVLDKPAGILSVC